MITILQLANHRLGQEARTAEDFALAGFHMIGGCSVCHATIAVYNAYPSHDGYWKCEDCIGDTGWPTVTEADHDLFHVGL